MPILSETQQSSQDNAFTPTFTVSQPKTYIKPDFKAETELATTNPVDPRDFFGGAGVPPSQGETNPMATTPSPTPDAGNIRQPYQPPTAGGLPPGTAEAQEPPMAQQPGMSYDEYLQTLNPVPATGSEDVSIRPGDPDAPTLGELAPGMPETERAEAAPGVTATEAGVTEATAAEVGTPGVAEADQATAGQVEGGPTEMSAAQQLADITAQDSPLMARARQQGLQQAGKRGLLNSTIAAQAAMGTMVDKALPLAQQDAATALQIAQQNADRQTQIEGLNAQLGTDVSKFNADQLNRAEQLAAQLETAVSQGNAEAYNAAQRQLADLQTRADLTHADQQFRASSQYATERNQMAMDLNRQITELNKQYMAGQTAIDVQQIVGQYGNLASQNESAARIFDSYLSGLTNIMANKDIDPSRATQYVNQMLSQMQGSLQFIQDINNLDLDEFRFTPGGRPPGGGGGGGGGGPGSQPPPGWPENRPWPPRGPGGPGGNR